MFFAPRTVTVVPAALMPLVQPLFPVKSTTGDTQVVGRAPDGDTVAMLLDESMRMRFVDLGAELSGEDKQAVTVRMYVVDALETHFQGFKQPKLFGDAATDFLLEEAGVRSVRWSDGRTQILSADDAHGVKLLAGGVDNYGRMIGYLANADRNIPDGQVDLTVDLFGKTINHALLQAGLAYPMVYAEDDGRVNLELLQEVIKVTAAAREQNRGLWAMDQTLTGAAILSVENLQENIVLYPKLFRRLISFHQAGGQLSDLEGFVKYLKEHPDPVLLFSAAVFSGQAEPTEAHLHDLCVVETREGEQFLKLQVLPEFIVFKPLRPAR